MSRKAASLAIAMLVCRCALTARAAEWGDLSGKMLYDGKPPAPARINLAAPAFAGLNIVDESLLVDSQGGIANVVIYLRAPNLEVHPDLRDAPPSKVQFDIVGGHTRPHVLALWFERQTLEIRNLDPLGHNIVLQPLGAAGANPLLPPNGVFEHKFDRRQTIPVPVSDNICPWLQGYVLPRDNPYFAVTASDGTFKIEKLPVGELQFQVWHEKAGYVDTVDLPKGRFTVQINTGKNDCGIIRVPAKSFRK